jgi:putative transposase
VSGRKYWLFDVIDQKTRFLLASRLTPTRATKDAALVMNEAKRRAGKSPKRILTDKAGAYVNAVDLVFGSETKHVQSSPFVETVDSTNIIERFQGTLKERTKVVRALKKPQTVVIEGFLVFYNYFRPHESLGGKTPSEVAKVSNFPFKNWLDVVKSQSPIVQTERLLASLPKNAEVRLPFRVPYRKRPKPKHKKRRTIHQTLSVMRA